MRRRTYLAVGASLCLAGCTASRSDDSSGGNGGGAERTTEDSSDPTGDGPLSDGTEGGPDAAGTEDDFTDLDAWEVVGGRLTGDTKYALVGPQSARLDVPATRRNAALSKTFAKPRDLTDVVPGVAVAADDLVAPRVRLVDDGGDSITYQRRIAGRLPLMRYNFGLESVDPGFDATAVREVLLLVWTGDDGRRTVWFDDLHFVPRPETGKVLIQFDDGNDTDYTEALPILEEYGYAATSFVNTDTIGNGGRLTTDQLHELRDAGWCIGNHTAGHPRLPDLSRTEQAAQIRDGREWLRERGFEDGAEYFAYPFGAYDATTVALVDDIHSIGFSGGRPVQGYTTNPRLASRLGEPDLDRAETALERTAELRGITGVLYHRLEGEDRADFERLVETIHRYESRGDLEVILPWDLEREYLF